MAIKLNQMRSPGYTWAVCVDESKNSLRALHFARNYIRLEVDRVIVLNVARNVPPRLQQDLSFKHSRLLDQLNASFVQLQAPPKATLVGEVLLQYLQSREVEAHFVVLGRTGRRAELEKSSSTGSVVFRMLQLMQANILVVT